MGLRNWLTSRTDARINKIKEDLLHENSELRNEINHLKSELDNIKNPQRLFNIEDYYKDHNICIDKTTEIQSNVLLGNNIIIGKKSYIVSGCIIGTNTEIGNYCSIANTVYIGLDEHPTNWLSTHPFQYSTFHIKDNRLKDSYAKNKKTKIGHDVWIGARAIIKSGISIGDGAIVGAGSVVTKNIPPFAIVAGSPAKLIRYRFDESTINNLLDLQWWNLDIEQIKHIDFNDIDSAITQLRGLNH